MASPIEQGKAPDPQVRTRRRRSRKPIVPELPTPQNATLIAQLGERFERRLAREEMPPELPTNIVFMPNLDKEYQRVVIRLRNELDEEPTLDQVATVFTSTKEKRIIVQNFGQQVPLTDNLKELPELRESVEDTVLRPVFLEEVKEILHNLPALSQLEQGIIFMRFGINTGEEKTPESIGEIYGVTGEIIRRGERAALSALRKDIRFVSQKHDVSEWGSRDKFFEESPAPTHSVDLLIRDVPIFDPSDDRPYIDRLKESAQRSAQFWLETKGWEIKALLYNPKKKLQAKSNAKKLRKKILEDQQEIKRQLKPLRIEKRRVQNRPLNPQSEDARAASLFLLDTKIQTLTAYSQLLQSYALHK